MKGGAIIKVGRYESFHKHIELTIWEEGFCEALFLFFVPGGQPVREENGVRNDENGYRKNENGFRASLQHSLKRSGRTGV